MATTGITNSNPGVQNTVFVLDSVMILRCIKINEVQGDPYRVHSYAVFCVLGFLKEEARSKMFGNICPADVPLLFPHWERLFYISYILMF